MITSTLNIERWKGTTALVTGASAGCGAAIASALVKNGINVVGLARRKEKVDDLAAALSNRPGRLYGYQADITKEEDIIEAFKWTNDNVGPVQILVNNAGISQPTNLSNGNTEMWKKILDTNVMGLCICTREAMQGLRKSKLEGHIIHISSVLGHYVPHIPDLNMYPASKFAVTALTETLRQEIMANDDNIKITSLSPGPVDTEFATSSNLYDNEEYAEFFKATPKLHADDVADALLYVLATAPNVLVQELTVRPRIEKV